MTENEIITQEDPQMQLFAQLMVDKSAVEYMRKLSELTAEVHRIGVNYNQVVRLMHFNTTEKSVKALLQELINFTNEIKSLQELAIKLTVDFRKTKEF